MKTAPIVFAVLLVWGSLAEYASAQPILNRVEKLLRDQLDAATPAAQPAEPGYLGLLADDTADAPRGVRVLEVYPGHAAARAGLRQGDLITQIDNRPIRTMDDVARALDAKPPGAQITIDVSRDGGQQQLTATLGRDPRQPQTSENDSPPAEKPADPAPPRLGVRSVPVTDAVRRINGLVSMRGAHVISVIVGSPAEQAGIPLGAVVTAVDKTPVDTPQELAAAIRGATTSPVELTYVHRGRSVTQEVALPVPPAAKEEGRREVRARQPLGEAPGPSDAAPSDAPPADAAPPVVENPALEQDDRVSKLERRLQELEARIQALEAERETQDHFEANPRPN